MNSCILSWGVDLKYISHCMVIMRMAFSLCEVCRVLFILYAEIPFASITTPEHQLQLRVFSDSSNSFFQNLGGTEVHQTVFYI